MSSSRRRFFRSLPILFGLGSKRNTLRFIMIDENKSQLKNEEIAAILVIGSSILESEFSLTSEDSARWVDEVIDELQSEGIYE